MERANEASNQSQNQWLSDQVAELRANIEAVSQEVLNELNEAAADSEKPHLSSAALCLIGSIHRLLDYLKITYCADSLSVVPPVVVDLLRINQNTGLSNHTGDSSSQIEAALSRRLLWITEVELHDDGLPVNAEEPIDLERAESDWFSIDTPVEVVVQTRISSGDFRFLDLLALAPDSQEPVSLEDMHSADLATARETLKNHKDRTRDAVEQAEKDGVIEFEGSRWSELTHSLDDILVDATLNFKRAHDILEKTESTVQGERINRREELNNDWEALIRELREDDSLGFEVLKGLSDTFGLASRDESLDIRVMEDCVTRARDYLSSGEHQDLVLNRSERSSDALEGFLRFTRGVGDLSPYPRGSNLRQLLSRIRGDV